MSDTVLVTGGAGFIGSQLAAELLREGYRVRVLDDLSQGRSQWIPEGAEFIEASITELEACRNACEGTKGVFHLAAMSRVAASLDNVEICTQNNIVGTANLLAAAREAGVAKVVYSASSTHYGNQKPPHIEEMRPEFLNFYCLSKYVGEEYCLLYDRTYDLPVVALRYFNVYGPRQPETGVYALVLGIFLRQWAQGQSLTIHGDGSQRRDFVHVKDVIAANVKAFRSDVRGQAFNVGSGTNISIKELADLISDNQSFGPRRPGDAEETLADITKIAASLHWKPQVSMTDGIEEMKALVASNVSGKS